MQTIMPITENYIWFRYKLYHSVYHLVKLMAKIFLPNMYHSMSFGRFETMQPIILLLSGGCLPSLHTCCNETKMEKYIPASKTAYTPGCYIAEHVFTISLPFDKAEANTDNLVYFLFFYVNNIFIEVHSEGDVLSLVISPAAEDVYIYFNFVAVYLLHRELSSHHLWLATKDYK